VYHKAEGHMQESSQLQHLIGNNIAFPCSEDIVPFAGDHSLHLSFQKLHSGCSGSYMNMNTKVTFTMLPDLLLEFYHLNVWLLICISQDLVQSTIALYNHLGKILVNDAELTKFARSVYIH
jgi:hypothetical protein